MPDTKKENKTDANSLFFSMVASASCACEARAVRAMKARSHALSGEGNGSGRIKMLTQNSPFLTLLPPMVVLLTGDKPFFLSLF